MTHSLKRNRIGRGLAVLAAVSLLAAACASDPSDSAAGDRVPDSAQSTATAGAGDAAVAADALDASSSRPSDGSGSTAPSDAAGDAASSGSSDSPSVTAPSQSAGDEQAETSAGGNVATAVAADDDAGGAAEGGIGLPAAAAGALMRFSECADFADYLNEHAAAAAWSDWGGSAGVAVADEDMAFAAADTEGGGAFGDASLIAGEDYSASNLQEAGVDEPDIVKTDGRRLVISLGDSIRLVDVSGSAPAVADSLAFEGQWVSALLLHGDRLLAFVPRWDVGIPFDDMLGGGAATDGEAPRLTVGEAWAPTLEVVEIDISVGQLTIVERLRLDGQYVGARMTDGVVRIVTASPPRLFPRVVPHDGGPQDGGAAAASDDVAFSAEAAAAWLPRFERIDADGTVSERGRLGACDRTWAPAEFAGPETLSVTTLDFGSDGVGGSVVATSILAGGQNIYASVDHLYVTTTRWDAAGVWLESLQSDGDSRNGAGPPELTTQVHQFDLSDPTEAVHVASASVPGVLLNQYSMSEHDGHLRIATTMSPPWFFGGDEPSESVLTVLDALDGRLSTVGQVGGLGLGERIFAVRYLGDIAAVVTFRQIDPLYLIDLSDPAVPRTTGELKITGYSAYLHPLGDDLLLGVGQEADLEGRIEGTQVSLFDIADMSAPERVDQWTLRGGHSSVEFDALRFLHWPASELVVMPVIQYLDSDDAGGAAEPPLLGAVALGTAGRRLTERARLSHANAPTRRCNESREIVIRPDGTEERGQLERYCWYDQDWDAQIVASVVVGDRLHLASRKGLQTVDLASLESLGVLRWAL